MINQNPFLIILGITQDGGLPHAGCKKECCQQAWQDLSKRKYPTCMAIVDPISRERWIIDVSPDFKYQLNMLDKVYSVEDKIGLNGIFLTHGHTGHYAGLIEFGKSIMGSCNIPVYAMPKMKEFIESNYPWKNLVERKNIILEKLNNEIEIKLNKRISIIPFLVPHRDEHTETVGFKIIGPNKKILFIPDIDKWEKWDKNIEDEIKQVDLAFLDATFYDENEIHGRNIKEIPHPFVIESFERFDKLDVKEKSKILFIHFNHTNPLLKNDSWEKKKLIQKNFFIAEENKIIII